MKVGLLDKYAFLHFLAGMIVYALGFRMTTWFVAHSLFEFVQSTKQGQKIIDQLDFLSKNKDTPETMINKLGDHMMAVLGWLAAYYLDGIRTRFGRERLS